MMSQILFDNDGPSVHERWDQNLSEEEEEKFTDHLDSIIAQNINALKYKVLDRRCSCCNKKFYSGSVCLQCKRFMHMACLEEDNESHTKYNRSFSHGSSINLVNYRFCPKCKCPVHVGVQCLSCTKVYHVKCLNVINCNHPKTVCLNQEDDCYKCMKFINVGIKCLLCRQSYHLECSKFMECCPHYFTVCVKMDGSPCYVNPGAEQLDYSIVKDFVRNNELGKTRLCLKCRNLFHVDCLSLAGTMYGCDHSSNVESDRVGVCCYKDCLHDMWNVHLQRLEYHPDVLKSVKGLLKITHEAGLEKRQILMEDGSLQPITVVGRTSDWTAMGKDTNVQIFEASENYDKMGSVLSANMDDDEFDSSNTKPTDGIEDGKDLNDETNRMDVEAKEPEKLFEEAAGNAASMFEEMSLAHNDTDSIKLLSAVIDDVHKIISNEFTREAAKASVSDQDDVILISDEVENKKAEVVKVNDGIWRVFSEDDASEKIHKEKSEPFKQMIKVVDMNSVINLVDDDDSDDDDKSDNEDDDDDITDEDGDAENEKEDKEEEEDDDDQDEIILDYSVDTSKRKAGSISLNFIKKKLNNRKIVPTEIKQTEAIDQTPITNTPHTNDQIVANSEEPMFKTPLAVAQNTVATNITPIATSTTSIASITSPTEETLINQTIEAALPKVVTTAGTHVPPIPVETPIKKVTIIKPTTVTLLPSPERINGVIVCAKCKHPPANPTTCPTCQQVFHPGCISSGFFNSTICTHLNTKSDDRINSYQTCDYCSRKVLMYIECKHCDKAFHASCMKRAIKACSRDFMSCVHRPHSSTVCEECSLYVENPIICSKCGKFYHQVCFNQINPSLNKCQHLSTYKLFDEQEAIKMNENRELAMKQLGEFKGNDGHTNHGSHTPFLNEMGLRRVFDFMLVNKELPLRSMDLYVTVFLELGINIAKCPVYQQRACVTLLTKFINDWALWKIEVLPEYEELMREKEEYKVQKEAGLVTREWSNVTAYQRFLRHKKAWNTKLFNYLKNKFAYVMPMLDAEQTGATPTTDYAVCIEGPPKNLNSIVFTLEGNDVTLKKHSDAPFNGTLLNYRQFMNHPYVNVHLQIADIDVKRCNVHEYDRYIMKGGVNVDLAEPQSVYSVWKIDHDLPAQVYTYLYFSKYFEQLHELMITNGQIAPIRINEIRTFFTEFLNDVAEMNMKRKTMATNTAVVLGIGCNKYMRSKQTTMKDINYWEVLTPKVLISLNKFSPTQDCHDANKISFRTLNKYSVLTAHFAKDINASCIIYECNLCNISFQWYYEIHDHFTAVHREENAVICYKCRASVEIHELTNSRWRHGCSA